MQSVTALRRWLVVVALLRLLSVYLGLFHHNRLGSNLFDKAPGLVNELYGRTFATWTLTSCVLCLICARNPRSPSIYGATLCSFIVALLHFLTELLWFDTISLKNALSPMIIAGMSTLWMGAGWNYYTTPEGPQLSEEPEPYEEVADQKVD